MDKYVAVFCAEDGDEGEVRIHLPDASGCYATLCGLDGNDPAVGQRLVDLPNGAKVNCQQCKAIWAVAKKYKASDFSA